MSRALEGLRILVVDDHADCLDVTAIALHLAGALVTTAGSATEALEHLRSGQLDVVVTDIGMPNLSGHDLIRQARAEGRQLPIVALTAYDAPEHRHEIQLSGFASHETKPCSPERLVDAVARVWAGRAGPRPLRSRAAQESVEPKISPSASIAEPLEPQPTSDGMNLRTEGIDVPGSVAPLDDTAKP